MQTTTTTTLTITITTTTTTIKTKNQIIRFNTRCAIHRISLTTKNNSKWATRNCSRKAVSANKNHSFDTRVDVITLHIPRHHSIPPRRCSQRRSAVVARPPPYSAASCSSFLPPREVYPRAEGDDLWAGRRRRTNEDRFIFFISRRDVLGLQRFKFHVLSRCD